MDNRSHEETEWDLDLLKLEIAELDTLDFDLKFTGFEPRQLEELLVGTDAAADEAANQAPPPPTQPVSRLGDLWQCGLHRVLHGDATNRDHTSRVLGDVRPLILITDPPYGVELNPMWRQEAGLGSPVQTGKVANDDRVDWSDAFPYSRAIAPTCGMPGSIPVWSPQAFRTWVSRFARKSFGRSRTSF
jgi:hypothetical protein